MAESFPRRFLVGRRAAAERVSLTSRFVKVAFPRGHGIERKSMNDQVEFRLGDINGRLARKLLKHFPSGIRRVRSTSGSCRSRVGSRMTVKAFIKFADRVMLKQALIWMLVSARQLIRLGLLMAPLRSLTRL